MSKFSHVAAADSAEGAGRAGRAGRAAATPAVARPRDETGTVTSPTP